MKQTLEIRTTNDGSPTLYNKEISESYHSMFGARDESMHIFISQGLNQCHKETINVLEVGFGTGLNAFLAALEAQKTGKKIHFTTVELYPLPAEIYTQLPYATNAEETNIFEQLHTCEWEKSIQITPNFSITKLQADIRTISFNKTFDCVFFDAFSPEKQPDLWDFSIFQKIYKSLKNNGLLTTYCAKGSVRRTLQSAEFTVERLAGPIGGKREILRAIKQKS